MGIYEELVARDTALGDSGPDPLLIMISLGGINHPVACLEGIAHTSLALRRVYLIYSISNHRHLDAVAES